MTEAPTPTTAAALNVDTVCWPPHKGGLHITHNRHHSYYETVEQAIGNSGDGHCTYAQGDFVDEAEVAICIATDSVWSIQWYPSTPVGFSIVHAASLSRALMAALS